MDHKKLTLRTAVILPLVIVFLFTLGVIAFVQYSSYGNMVTKLSHKQLVAFTENANTKLKFFLKAPYKANAALARTITFSDLYHPGDMTDFQTFVELSFNDLSK